MIPQVLPPDVGSGLKASWGASVAGAINTLAAGLETRAKPLENQRNRRGDATKLKPWHIKACTKSEGEGESDVKLLAIYLPAGSLVFDGKEIDAAQIAGLDPYGEEEDWYLLYRNFDDYIYLVIKKIRDDMTFSLQGDNDDKAIFSLKIASINEYKVHEQIIEGPLILFPGGIEVTGTGPDHGTFRGSKILFTSASDSNVEVTFSKDSTTGLITAKIGVYWV